MTSEIKDPEIDAKSLSFLSNLMMMMLCFRVTHNFMSRTWNSEHVNFHMTLKSYLIITFWTYSSKKRHKARIKLARGLYTAKNIHSKWKIETYYILCTLWCQDKDVLQTYFDIARGFWNNLNSFVCPVKYENLHPFFKRKILQCI